MEDTDDDDIVILEERQGNRRKGRKWNVPNPLIRKGSESTILESVRKALDMEDSLQAPSCPAETTSALPSNFTSPSGESVEPSVASLYELVASPARLQTANTLSAPVSLTPEQVKELTENCLDSDNEPVEESTAGSSHIKDCDLSLKEGRSPTQIKASFSVLNKASRFFGAGTSRQDAFEILTQGMKSFGKSPSKSPSGKKRRLTKNSPIRMLPKVANALNRSPRCSRLNSPVKNKSPRKDSACRMLLNDLESQENGTDMNDGPYYYEAFCFILKKILSSATCHHLFIKEELEKISDFKESRKELQLYVRLINRKDKWNRVKDIRYNDIDTDLSPLFEVLEKKQYISCDLCEEKLEDLLPLLNVAELKLLCSQFKTKTGTKSHMVKALLDLQKTQPSLGTSNPLRSRTIEYLGPCVRLSFEWRLVFRRCIILFSMFHSKEELDKLSGEQALLLLQVKLGRMKFPECAPSQQYSQIFMTRDQFIRYEEARELTMKFRLYQSEKDYSALLEFTNHALMRFATLLELHDETDHILQLPSFLQKFSAGSVYVYILTLCVDEMKKAKKYSFALQVLETLLGQTLYRQHCRGIWTLQLCTLLHVNLKEIEKASFELHKGLSNHSFGVVDRMHLQRRAEQLLKSKRKVMSAACIQTLESVMDSANTSPKSVCISGCAFPGSKPGLRKVYVRDTEDGKEYMSVEETVRAHYRNRGFVYGVHDEGNTIASLCYLSLWDVIYDSNVPLVFQSPYQDRPLDWGSKSFFTRREIALENRLKYLLSNTEELIAQQLVDHHLQYMSTTSVVSWERLENLNIQVFLKCLTVPLFVAICRRLIKDLKSHRSGFPDLVMWNPESGECLFIEVKSPNDTLSTVQSMWLDYLNANKGTAFVANVKDTGSKGSVQ